MFPRAQIDFGMIHHWTTDDPWRSWQPKMDKMIDEVPTTNNDAYIVTFVTRKEDRMSKLDLIRLDVGIRVRKHHSGVRKLRSRLEGICHLKYSQIEYKRKLI